MADAQDAATTTPAEHPPELVEDHGAVHMVPEGSTSRKATRVSTPELTNERQRFRTTVFLSPELEDLVDRMKLAAKRQGRRETLQFYVEEGIRLVARERGITLD
jgi:hypothetical protein